MFTSSIRLAACRPSPTTVSFTTSNAPARTTFAAQALYWLLIFLRAAICFCTLLVLLTKLQWSSGKPEYSVFFIWIPLPITNAVVERPWEFILPISLAVLFLCFRRFHTEESLLVLRTLGIQTSTTSSTYLSTATTRFIPTSQIQDIFIHEAFRGFEVRYYLAVIVEGEEEVTVVFPNLLPNLEIVEKVWRGARECLFESGSKATNRPK